MPETKRKRPKAPFLRMASCKPGKPRAAADCAACPLAWEDMSYEGECYDCGCVATKRMDGRRLVCRLPLWAKRLIRRRSDARLAKLESRRYDGIGEWCKEQDRKDAALQKAFLETFPGIIPGHDKISLLRMRYEHNLKKEASDDTNEERDEE